MNNLRSPVDGISPSYVKHISIMFEFVVEESKRQRKGSDHPESPLNICGNVIRQISPSCCWTLIRLDLKGLSHLTQAHQHTPPPITSSIKDINLIKI